MDEIYPLLIEADGIIIGAPVYFGILPSAGWGGDWQHMILPSLTIAAYPLAILTRLTRLTMLEVIQQDYIRTARSMSVSIFIIMNLIVDLSYIFFDPRIKY